jgi:hypothetical protein
VSKKTNFAHEDERAKKHILLTLLGEQNKRP